MTKQRRIYVAVPIVTSEDGQYCGNNCEFADGVGCDLVGLCWTEKSDKRFSGCKAAERRLLKIVDRQAEAAMSAVLSIRTEDEKMRAQKRGRKTK